MPYVYPNTKPHDHDHTIHQTTSHLTTIASDIDTVSQINHNPFSNRHDAKDAAVPSFFSSVNVQHASNKYNNSIFMPASTSKYPIKENSIRDDLRERFQNFFTQWIKTIVYLARK